MPDGARPALYGVNEGMRNEGGGMKENRIQKPEVRSQKTRKNKSGSPPYYSGF
jgi:hypothetical protein